MRCFVVGVAAAAMVSAVSSARAAIPAAYSLQLQARAQIGGTGFNLPNLSSLSNTSPVINDSGTVSFRVATVGSGSQDGIWYGGRGTGSVVYTNPTTGLISSTTGINNAGDVAFAISDLSPGPGFGVYRYSATGGAATLASSAPLGASFWSPRINTGGQIGARASVSGANLYVSYSAATPASSVNHAAEVSVDASSPYSFLFSPNFDDSRRITGVVRVGPAGSSGDASRPDQLRQFNPDGSSTLLVEDQNSNPLSLFNQFDATAVGSSDSGNQVSFIARTTSSAATRGVFLYDSGSIKTIATPGVGLTSIDNFSSAVNDSGLVVFRATDLSGSISIFLGDGSTVQRLVGVGDSIETDLGPRTIAFLSGNPEINNNGDVVFSAQLASGGNVVVAAYVPEPASLSLLAPAAAALRRRRTGR